MATRTQHAKRNIITSIINKLMSMLAVFVMRTIIIRYLGALYLGLDSLFASLLQILSLAELGVGAAMVFSMYKPIAEGDTPAICALLNLYRTFYRWIAVIMAAGAFTLGSSIEISADGPLREPYAVYLQGGLTFEHAAIGILGAAQELENL